LNKKLVTLSSADFIMAQQCNYAGNLRLLDGRLPGGLTVTTTALRWVLKIFNVFNHLTCNSFVIMFKYNMYYLFWLIVLAVIGGAIYWLMDWKKHHPDGE